MAHRRLSSRALPSSAAAGLATTPRCYAGTPVAIHGLAMANRVSSYLSSLFPCTALLTSLFVGCADRSPIDNHDAALPDVDARTPDVPSDPDAGCTCTTGDGGWKDLGVVETLACFCAWPSACLDYATALASCRAFANDSLEVYTACNLEVIRFPGTYDGGRALVYDATTHELVGGRYASDTPSFECGSARVIGRRAGIFPPEGCALTRTVRICPPDAQVKSLTDLTR